MNPEKIYWTQKNGEKVDVDDMSETHLRNTLKHILRKSIKNIGGVAPFSEAEIEAIAAAQGDDWRWK